MTPRKEVVGDCELWLGDCREVLPTLSGVDLVVTDPPYSVSVPGVGRWEMRYGRTDDLDFFETDRDWSEMTATVRLVAGLCASACAQHGSMYFWCGHRQFGEIIGLLEEAGWKTRFLVWSKMHPMPAAPRSGWPSAAELCIYAYRAGRRWTFDGVCPFRSNVFTVDSFRFGQPGKVDHPTQKPIGVIDPQIRASSRFGDLVIDPFMGSGTTGVACAQLGRRFIGIEIEPAYYEIALRRIEQATRQGDLIRDVYEKPQQRVLL